MVSTQRRLAAPAGLERAARAVGPGPHGRAASGQRRLDAAAPGGRGIRAAARAEPEWRSVGLPDMPRYFLNIRAGDELIEDPDGSDLPDLAAARGEALAGARALLAEKVKTGLLVDGQRFEITDELGAVLDVVPLKDALKLR